MLTHSFFSKKIPFPKVTPGDCLRQAVTDLLDVLKEQKRSFPTLTYVPEKQRICTLSTDLKAGSYLSTKIAEAYRDIINSKDEYY